MGDRLQYFQIGNEPDLFSRHLRDPKTWSALADDFRTFLLNADIFELALSAV